LGAKDLQQENGAMTVKCTGEGCEKIESKIGNLYQGKRPLPRPPASESAGGNTMRRVEPDRRKTQR